MIRRSLWILLIMFAVAVPVGAQESDGSIRLYMRCQGKSIAGGAVTIYNVSNMDLSDTPEQLQRQFQAAGITGKTAVIRNDGTACFTNLEKGYYLLVQETAPKGYLAMRPFFISIPSEIDDQVQYHIEARPKLQQIPEENLPQTGQLQWPVWLLLGMGMIAMGTGTLLLKRK